MAKKFKWQDIDINDAVRYHDGYDKEDAFAVASLMNAYAWGDVVGGGIDVRCPIELQEEALDIFYDYFIKGMVEHFIKKGWEHKVDGTYDVFTKQDCEVYIEEGAYFTMQFVGESSKNICNYFDK